MLETQERGGDVLVPVLPPTTGALADSGFRWGRGRHTFMHTRRTGSSAIGVAHLLNGQTADVDLFKVGGAQTCLFGENQVIVAKSKGFCSP